MTLALFAEGVASLVLPCTWVLVVPVVLSVTAGRGRPLVVTASAAGLIGGSMLRAGGEGVLPPALAIPGGLLLALAFVPLWRVSKHAAIVGAFAVGWVATSLWQPCVGTHLGAVLNAGIDEPGRAAISVIPFAAGVALVTPAVGFSIELLNPEFRERVAMIATVVGVALGLAVMVGVHETVIARLAAWSVGLTT